MKLKRENFDYSAIVVRLIFCEIAAIFILFVIDHRYAAPGGHDALTYHLTYPACWIKEGWFQMLPAWFEPIEISHHPLLTQILCGLLMLPWKSEIIARFLQVPFLIISTWCIYAIARTSGCKKEFSLLSALGVLTLQPFLRDLFIGYNDIIFMCFFLLAILMIMRLHFSSSKELTIPAFGITLGLLASTKYFALVYIPSLIVSFIAILLLQRGYFCYVKLRKKIVYAILAIAGFIMGTGTYLRNFILTNNPFYPADVTIFGINVFKGMFDPALFGSRPSLNSFLHLLANDHSTFAMPQLTGLLLCGCMVLAFALTIYAFKRKTSGILIALFFIPVSVLLVTLNRLHWTDVRFMYPIYALMWVYPAIVCTKITNWKYRSRGVMTCALGLLVIISTREFVDTSVFLHMRTLKVAVVLFTSIYWLFPHLSNVNPRRILGYPIIILLLIASGNLYFYWPQYKVTYQNSKAIGFYRRWGDLGSAWNWLEDTTYNNPSVICYTGTGIIYPLYGNNLQNRVYYAHIAPGNFDYLHEYGAHFSQSLSQIEELYRGKEDVNFWLENIKRLECDFLLVSRLHFSPENEFPIEASWAMKHPELFSLCFDRPMVKIFKCLK